MGDEGLLYSGKAKNLYATEDEQELRVVYLDQATALNGLRKDTIPGKAKLNNQITSLIFQYLKQQGGRNHFIKKLSATEQLVTKVEMIPLEVVLRNIATGSFVEKFQVKEGHVLNEPLLEFYYKNDALADPLLNEAHIKALELATVAQVAEIYRQTLELNQQLTTLFAAIGLILVDFKVEFGLTKAGQVLLADEITPDTCRLWEEGSKKSFDKDVYRKETGDLVSVYEEVYHRLVNSLG